MSLRTAKRYRLLALGDSYTAGEGVPPSERWPEHLRQALKAASPGAREIEVEFIAQTGWTTDELASAIAEAGPPGPYDLVTLLVGVNNQYRGRSLQEYRVQFRALLEAAIVLAGGDSGHVLVLSIPDWGVTPFAEGRDREQIAREIDAFNAVNRDEAAAAGARYVDITAISRQARDTRQLLADDGLHPSGRMYRMWANAMLSEVIAALRIAL